MKGSVCLIITRNEQGQSEIVNTTQIVNEVAPGKYLVSFLNPPPFQRVCNIEEIQSWMIFPSQEAANNWITGNAAAPGVQEEMPIEEPATEPPAVDDNDHEAPTPKKDKH